MADEVAAQKAEQVASYIRSLPGFEKRQQGGDYNHVGATLANVVLQSNNNYERTVRPRIKRIREKYADATTLHDLDRVLKQIGPQEFLRWNGTRKPKTFLELIDLLLREGVNSERDLREWLKKEGSEAKLLKIRFIGQKSVDYLKIWSGRMMRLRWTGNCSDSLNALA